MENHVRAVSALALLWLLWTASYAHAQRFSSMPITLRIEGFVRPEPHGVVPQATWVVRVQHKEYTLQVMRLEVLRGNTAYFNVIAALEPYTYAFTVYGHDDALRTFTQAPPEQALAIIGTAQLAQLPGLLFINSIESMATPTPAMTPGAALPSRLRTGRVELRRGGTPAPRARLSWSRAALSPLFWTMTPGAGS